MKATVVYAKPGRQAVLSVEIPEGTNIREAIERSGVLQLFPEIDLTKQKIGVFSKFVGLETRVDDGARIEIYRPITADPTKIRRRQLPRPASAQT
jgi:putative ubiquitin-RnfH superfamily antitoxin RatB of RatAB toxin-antitoxin module